MDSDNVLERGGRSRLRRRKRRQLILFGGVAWLTLIVALAYGMGLIGTGDDDDVVADSSRPGRIAVTPEDIDYLHPVGLVTEIRGADEAEIGPYEYVYSGQRIPLSVNASISIAYFESCREEVARGAEVIVGPSGSEVGAQGSKQGRALRCRPERMMKPGHMVQPGTAAYESPFDIGAWNESTVKSDRPVFMLPEKLLDAKISVEVLDVDTPNPTGIWAGEMTSHFLAYPVDAPRLAVGKPYSVKAMDDSGKTYQAIFSVEPDSGASQSKLNDFVVMNPAQEDQP